MYVHNNRGGIIPASNASLTPMTLTTAASGVYARWIITRQCILKQLLAVVTTNVTCGTANPVVLVRRRPTYNSTAGQVSVSAITIPTGSTVGQLFYKNVTPTKFFPGDEISFETGTGGTDAGTAAGAALFDFLMDTEPENPSNETDMTASA